MFFHDSYEVAHVGAVVAAILAAASPFVDESCGGCETDLAPAPVGGRAGCQSDVHLPAPDGRADLPIVPADDPLRV